MKETNLAQVPTLESTRETENPTKDLRLLDDLELSLAAGGDTVVSWP